MQTNSAYKIVIIDTRNVIEFEQEHISGALNIPYQLVIASRMYSDSTIVAYCASDRCPTSKLAAKALVDAGYNAMALEGGLETWKALGYKTEGIYSVSDVVPAEKVIYAEVLRDKLSSSEYVVVDTRPAKEYKAAHLPGAINKGADELEGVAGKLDKSATFVVCDRDSARAKKAVAVLKKQGFNAVELSGGIAIWAGKKFPIAVGGYKK